MSKYFQHKGVKYKVTYRCLDRSGDCHLLVEEGRSEDWEVCRRVTELDPSEQHVVSRSYQPQIQLHNGVLRSDLVSPVTRRVVRSAV